MPSFPGSRWSLAYSIHIPTSYELDLREALDPGSRAALSGYLRLIAELAETTDRTDEVWSRLDRDDDGYFRWFSAQCSVLFEVDRGHRVIAVRNVLLPGVRKAS